MRGQLSSESSRRIPIWCSSGSQVILLALHSFVFQYFGGIIVKLETIKTGWNSRDELRPSIPTFKQVAIIFLFYQRSENEIGSTVLSRVDNPVPVTLHGLTASLIESLYRMPLSIPPKSFIALLETQTLTIYIFAETGNIIIPNCFGYLDTDEIRTYDQEFSRYRQCSIRLSASTTALIYKTFHDRPPKR
jgi:hypothetical protein